MLLALRLQIAGLLGRLAQSANRWLTQKGYNAAWGERARVAARFVPASSTVVDLGCGQMQVREFLPHGCRYTPADLTKWTDEVYKIDLDAGIFPPGSYDCALMLGVIEYLHAPSLTLAWARGHCGRLITTYMHPKVPPIRHVRANLFSESELRRLLERNGWTVAAIDVYRDDAKSRHLVYACEHISSDAGHPYGGQAAQGRG